MKNYVRLLKDFWNLSNFSEDQYEFLENLCNQAINSKVIYCKKSKLFELDYLEFYDEFALYMGFISNRVSQIEVSFVKKEINFIWIVRQGYSIEQNIIHINDFLRKHNKIFGVFEKFLSMNIKR